MILLGSLALGGILGIGVALTADELDNRIHSLDDLRRAFDLPVLGLISRITPEQLRDSVDGRLISHTLPWTPAAEAYKALRTNIEFLRRDRNVQVILITSSVAREGKTTTASNLAISLAHAGRKVLLVDADLRRAALDKIYDLPAESGLAQLLEGKILLGGAVQPTQIADLDLITAGCKVANPAELLMSTRMREFVDEARRSYDYVIIDSSPLLAVTDPALIGVATDGVVLVLRVPSEAATPVQDRGIAPDRGDADPGHRDHGNRRPCIRAAVRLRDLRAGRRGAEYRVQRVRAGGRICVRRPAALRQEWREPSPLSSSLKTRGFFAADARPGPTRVRAHLRRGEREGASPGNASDARRIPPTLPPRRGEPGMPGRRARGVAGGSTLPVPKALRTPATAHGGGPAPGLRWRSPRDPTRDEDGAMMNFGFWIAGLMMVLPPPIRGQEGGSPSVGAMPLVLSRCATEYVRSTLLGAVLPGILQDCLVQPGDRVKAGQVLGRIQDREARAEMELRRAQAESDVDIRLKEAKHARTLIRLKASESLNQRSMLSLDLLSVDRLDETIARLEVENAKLGRRMAQLQLAQSQATVGAREIVATHDGVVVAVLKQAGESVTPVMPIFQVVDPDRIQVVGSLDVQDATRVRRGQVVRVSPVVGGADLEIENARLCGSDHLRQRGDRCEDADLPGVCGGR